MEIWKCLIFFSVFAWDVATPLINQLIDWRNQEAHPLPYHQDFTHDEHKAFMDSLQIMENEEVIDFNEKLAISQMIDEAHYVTRPARRRGPSVDPFTGTERKKRPKRGRKI